MPTALRPARSTLARAGRLAALSLALIGASAMAAPLKLAVSRSQLSLPLFVAQDKGFITQEGLDVAVVDCQGGHRCLRLLLDGQADVATAGDMPITFNSAEHPEMAVLATIVTTLDDVKLLSHAPAKLSTAAELGGRRVGATLGSSSQYFLELSLLTAGVDPRSVSIVNLQPDQMLPALLSGQVDAVATWEPFAHQAARSLGAAAVPLTGTTAYIQTFNLVTSRPQALARPEDLKRLLRAVEKAQQFIHQQPDAAKALLQRRLQVDAATVDASWSHLDFRLALEQSLISTLEGEWRWARREGHIAGQGSPNFLALIHSATLSSVKPAAVGIMR